MKRRHGPPAKPKKPEVRRHIEDAPFFKLVQGLDDLPLDPLRPFIEQKIQKFRFWKPIEFEHDYKLHSYPTNVGVDTTYGFVVPSKMVEIMEKRNWNYSFNPVLPDVENEYPWLDEGEKPSEDYVRELTPRIVHYYVVNRMNVFKHNWASLVNKEKYRRKAKARRFKPGDDRKLRTEAEIQAELDRMKQVIDDMIGPQIERHRKKQFDIRNGLVPVNTKPQIEETCLPTSKKIIEPRYKKPRESKEQVMLRLKQLEKIKLRDMMGMLPVDPEEQKATIVRKYATQFEAASYKFSDLIKDRTINLMKFISVKQMESYPSRIIIKLLPRIEPRLKFLGDAYRFILKERLLWPEVSLEIILADYLFDQRHHVKEEVAAMIIILLLDLQEDYRYAVKRAFLKSILKCPKQRIRLQLEREPPEFPWLTIRGPVPWKCNYQIASNRIHQMLMTTHPVMQALSELWYQLYYDFVIFDTSKCYKDSIPLHYDVLTEVIHNACLEARDIIMNDWLPRAADLIDSMRQFWQGLVPGNSKTGGLGVTFFKGIHALMSYQLRDLIKRSIDHLFNTIKVYGEGNFMRCPYDVNHPLIKRRPFITLNVSVVGKFCDPLPELYDKQSAMVYQPDAQDPNLLSMESPLVNPVMLPSSSFVLKNGGKMIVEPMLQDLPDLFVSYFVKIIKVGNNVPRMEYYMTGDPSLVGFLMNTREDHVDMQKLYDEVRTIVRANEQGPRIYLYPIYKYYFPLLCNKLREMALSIFSQLTIPSLLVFQCLMSKLDAVAKECYFLVDFVPLNLMMLDCRRLNRVLVNMVHEVGESVTNYFKALNTKENRRICDEFEEMSQHASERPKETPEVVALQNYINNCREDRIFVLKQEIKATAERVKFLMDHADINAEDIYLNSRTFLWPGELEIVLNLSAIRLTVIRENLEVALKERRGDFEHFLAEEKKKMEMFRLREIKEFLTLDELKEKCDISDEHMDVLEKSSREAKAINRDENLLQLDVSSFPVLGEMIDKMTPIESLWKTVYQFEQNYEQWYYGPFKNLDADAIREEVEIMFKALLKLTKQLSQNPQAKRVAEQGRIKIAKFKLFLPILDAICCQGMLPRHWDQLTADLGQPINSDLYPTLHAMIEVGVQKIYPKLEAVALAAGNEFELNMQLANMQQEWTDIKFELSEYRDTGTRILAALDDIQTLLDDHILKSQSMRGSPFIHALGDRANDWEEKLVAMQDIMDVWMSVQSTWMYLEPIFSSEDIMRQMPTEGRNFKSVDRIWRKIMDFAIIDPGVIRVTDYPNLLESMRKAFVDLEGVQKGLNTYLEKKRLFFARFFFLSNDELLEILSETKDPMRVQPHLKKCFEGICLLEFNDNMEIGAMISSEDEKVPLTRKISPNAANGLVEKWLKEVQEVMLESILRQCRLAYDAYWSTLRQEWVLRWPGQVVQTISCHTWTKEVEDAIEANTLPAYLQQCTEQIEEIVKLVRGKLSAGATIAIEALVVLDVHDRDIVKHLVDKKVKDISDFDWMAQLRYYWRFDSVEKTDTIAVSMVATDVRYGMEYLGNVPRLVVTPLTDRCYRTLMGAFKFYLGGAPEGPAGTGKTETCKDLAKAVAKKCVVFNCSDGLDYKALGKFFKGLAQSGSWACFDEFNRIELEVLSVVAQQIMTIQRAVARKVVKFFFEDTLLKLDPTCNIFITMNPGYAGRTELPDNLKVLFRTVAMMVPDYAMIGEITLYSTGFSDARPLAQKIVHTYKLCSEQLSSQHHYDYGMRAVKSVLLASGALRKMYPELSEAKIVLKAIVDVNLPKFLQEDVPLFEGIYSDLFPGVALPEASRDDIVKWLNTLLAEKKLQATPWFVEKVLQLYEMMLVRHGIMVVGATMGGKTTSWQTLAECLKNIHLDPSCTMDESEVMYRIINPKSITLGQLYGCFDPLTHEWSDGVLAKTYREMVYNPPSYRGWIMFDGPVDAVWIENLNTVLDDNKKLCLMSGEIIEMTKQMNMMFEPCDLEQASPATVSRVGMIYMEPAQLGWRTFHQTFVEELIAFGLNEIYMGLFEALIEWIIPALLEILEKCKSVLPVTPMHKYRIFGEFFMAFLVKQTTLNQTWFQQIFLYCVVWAYGSALDNEGRKILDSLFRKVIYGSNDDRPKPKLFSLNRGQMFPEKLTIMDYRFDGIETWWPWLKSEDAHIPATTPITEVMVPTRESGYIVNWLEHCLSIGKPILIVGPTGTGKSATIFNMMKDLPKDKYTLNTVNFSARTTASQVQELIMSKLDRRRKGVFGPPVGKKCAIFVDDVAMPECEKYGAQPALELLRQWLDHGYWSDLKDTTKIEMVDLLFLGAMGKPGGSNFIFPRFYRHTFVLAVDSFEDSTINTIFSAIIDWHFAKGYAEKVVNLSKGLSAALCEVYRGALLKFLPTPEKSHYTFSLRDVTRVVQGLVMVPASRLLEPEKLVRLWAHETYRVFYDRLIEQSDRDTLLELTQTACRTSLRIELSKAFENRIEPGAKITDNVMRDLLFGNYMEPDADPRFYDEVEDWRKLERVMHLYLNEFNSISHAPMDLVLFRFAIEHISRVSRILQMPRGNVLMVGLGGSGRRSAVKLAASMCEAGLFQVEVGKCYEFNDWREDMKKLLMRAGISNKTTVFLFCDSQAKDESFIDDINALLNTGDLPNLFASEEKAIILESMTTAAKQSEKQIDTTPIALYGFFIERVRENLRIALAFSPIGDSFKNRLRIFPSLINCCTIDWFVTWPDDALFKVATNVILSMKLDTEPNTVEVEEKPEEEAPKVDGAEEVDEEEHLTDLEKNLTEMVMYFNTSVVDASDRFFNELSRKNYVTPTSYLEMLRSFKILFNKKYSEITMKRDRYTTGLEKLDNAAAQVAIMQKTLIDLQPKLQSIAAETEKIMITIERETAEAEKKKELVGADEAAANEAAAAAQAIKDDCDSDLQEAIPALNAALAALNTLNPAHITIVKSMKNPPSAIKLVMEAVCVIRGVKPDRKPDAAGKMVEDYWAPSLKMLSDMKFLDQLRAFDKDNIPPAIMKRIRTSYITNRDFVPDIVKAVSTACEGLCKWVRAMDVYDRVAKIVAPKKQALAEAEAELNEQMDTLKMKQAELQVILDKLQSLNDFFAEKSKQKKNLEDEIDNCEKKLTRAEALLGGLGGEKDRWSENAVVLNNSLVNVVGDVLLASGCVAYLGCFTVDYRETIIVEWHKRCIIRKIPCSLHFSLPDTLGDAMQIRAWSLWGLPFDNFSVENAIIVTNARRYPLMIDPQVQANKWVKNMEKENNLKVIKLSDSDYVRTVENAIKNGYPVLLENIGESIDSVLFSVLERNVIKLKGQMVIKFGDGMIEYNPNFKFYITTCLRNPHYLPETAVLVTLLNFMITEQGLKEQLLATVVVQERPDLQEKKEMLIVESSRNRDLLYTLESKILEVLSSSEGNILEDENAITILSSSKVLSEDIQAKQLVAVVTEKEIDEARQQYIPVASYSSVLFFCITELANIDPMYQYSLAWFQNLFVMTILKAPQSSVLEERLQNLCDFFTKSVYENVCRSLFEKDKLVFSTVMCLGIKKWKGGVDDQLLLFFLAGGVGLDNPHANPAPAWLSDRAWTEIVRASVLPGLQNFFKHFQENVGIWREYYDLTNPQTEPMPEPFNTLSPFHQLIIMKCIRPDKIVPAMRNFIVSEIGQTFIEPPTFDLLASYNDSISATPLIFLLSPGSEPMANLLAFAKEREMYDHCKSISLGQGQGPRAAKLIADGCKLGHWVVLENCHVAESWMGELERICMDPALAEHSHENFRLWCTSYPSRTFPVAVLQNSVKMTNEPPKGLRMNLMRSFTSSPLVNDKFFSNAFGGQVGQLWLRGVFGLVFFHAVIQERREYGPLGWNIPYEFTQSDLNISLMQLKMFLKQYELIPFEGHCYLTGECNYGGRVTDDKDRRLMNALLTDLYNENTVGIDNYNLTSSGEYTVPLVPNRLNSIEYINTLPMNSTPEVFGLHENADISKNNKETDMLLVGVLSTQTALMASIKSKGTGKATVDPVLALCTDILRRLPSQFDMREVSEKFPIVYTNSMNTVLRQELIRFNRLLSFIRKSLVDVRRAIYGEIAMIPSLETVHTAMSIGRLPDVWAAKSYPSLKPLGSYISDFLQRLQFQQDWIDNGEPNVYWLSGLYFTQSFITGVMQNYSRKNQLQIDLVTIKYDVTQFETEVGDEQPEIGVFVKGLYLEGARWNRSISSLDEPLPKILFDTMPIMVMRPLLKADVRTDEKPEYQAPIYKTSARRGTLSTTGHSTNFVMFIELATINEKPRHWIKRGTAVLCQLDD